MPPVVPGVPDPSDVPYTDFGNETEDLGSLPRGGWLDFAETWRDVPFVRVSADDANGDECEFYLHVDQARKLHEEIGKMLARRAQPASSA